MSVTGGNSAPNSAASHISAIHSPLQMQQQQAAKIEFPSYNGKNEGMNDEHLAADSYRVKSPSALSHSASVNEPIRSSSASGINSAEGPENMSYLYQQQQYLNGFDANSRGFPASGPVPQSTSPFQPYGNVNAGFVNGVPMNMGMGVGMDDMIGKWIDSVGGGIMPSGLNGGLAVGNAGPMSNLAAAAAAYNTQQHSGNMSQADRQAWLAKSIFGGHGQNGTALNAMGVEAAMGMYNGGGGQDLSQQQQQQQQRSSSQHQRQETQTHSRVPGTNSQTYGLPMHDGFSGANPGFPAFVPDPMYGNGLQSGSSQTPGNQIEHAMGYQQSEFDIARMNAALAGMNFSALGEPRAQSSTGGGNQGLRPLTFDPTTGNQGPPSISSGRGSINSSSVPGSALSQLSAGSSGTGMTSLSGGSGNVHSAVAVPGHHHHSINVNSANGRAMIGGLLDEDVIPTAIVIKNIPFDVVKEKMMEVISSLGAPLPYAFNYHYENNQFRGLAFANFRQPFEADSVVAALNGYDLLGRKLRVEYKKVLQVGEKERIEKEKAIRRMKSAQLRGGGNTTPNSTSNPSFAAQQRPGMNGVPPMPNGGLVGRTGSRAWHSSHSFGETSSNAPEYMPQYVPQSQSANFNSPYDNSTSQPTSRDYSSQSASSPSSSSHADPASNGAESSKEQESSSVTPVTVDHTDPWTFDMHTKLVMFMADRATDETTFSSNLTAREKRIVHALAERLGLQHADVEGRVIVGKVAANVSQNHTPLGRPPMRKPGVQPGSYLHPHAAGGPGPSHGLRNRTSMPNLNGMNVHSSAQREQPSRLLSRQSNQNLRDFAMRTGNAHSSSNIGHHQPRRPFISSSSGTALQGSQGFNSIFGSSLAPSSGSALEIMPSPTSPSDPSMPAAANLTLPSRGFAASRSSFRSRHGSTESARNSNNNAHTSGVIGSQRPFSVNGMTTPSSATFRPDDRSGHTSGSSVIEEEDGSGDDKASRES